MVNSQPASQLLAHDEEEKFNSPELCYLRTKADGMKEYSISIDDENMVLSRHSKRGPNKLTYALNTLQVSLYAPRPSDGKYFNLAIILPR